ncbi:hypothetical protein TI05_14000 [Achromatium sp. WMS3]|nr:hypothetical protein TI05_14000 [Achromatium sp. WMS3]
MKIYKPYLKNIIFIIIIANLPLIAYSEVCQYENIGLQIKCLKNLGVSVDKFTEAYLRWVSDLKKQLEAFNNEAAKCSVLRWRLEQDVYNPTISKEIKEKCEGPMLEDRLRRFNAMRNNYIITKQRYEKIKHYYNIAKELLEVLETRQRQLEYEYDRYEKNDFSGY